MFLVELSNAANLALSNLQGEPHPKNINKIIKPTMLPRLKRGLLKRDTFGASPLANDIIWSLTL